MSNFFSWMDKLGQSALLGLNSVLRQSLFNANYALINELTEPNPVACFVLILIFGIFIFKIYCRIIG